MTEEMRITSIKVGERYRHAMGDIGSLAASIRETGLLHPVVVSSTGELIAGARRLEACKALGWTWIPARVVDLDDALQAELDENTARKDFTPSEIAAIAKAMREREEGAARERMAEAGRSAAPGHPADESPAKFAEVSDPDAGRVTSKIAARTGVSREQVRKIERVVEAAEREPEVFAPLVAEMDSTGKVDAAYQAVRRVESEREQAQTDQLVEGVIERTPGLANALELNRKKGHWNRARAALVQMRIDLVPSEVPHLCETPTEIENGIAALQRAREWLSEVEAALAASVGLRLVASDA